MRRVGALTALVIFATLFFAACEEETTAVDRTGIEMACSDCFAFKVDLFVDGDPVGSFSSEEPAFFEIPSGSHRLYAVSNAIENATNLTWCWTADFSVSDGNVTRIILECSDDSRCSI